MLIALFISFIWALACLLFDSYHTNKGIKEGVAVEGNPIITAIWGVKPKFWQLWSVDGTIRALMLAAALLLPAPADYQSAWYAVFFGGFLSFGLKNIQGGRQWIWMEQNPGHTIPLEKRWWAQILGFWG
jgi:hypothetical protein